MALQILDKNLKKSGEVQLSEDMGEKLNKAVLYYAVKAFRNGLRRGTASVTDRHDVNRTNKKIYKQKGSGNARHGAKKSNIFVGGASAHGPRPRSYTEKVNKKFRQTSYKEAFKYLIQEDKLKLMSDLNFDKPSTKTAVGVLSKLNLSKVLVVLPQDNVNAEKSFRNIKDVKVIKEQNINVYDLVRYESVIMTSDFFGTLKERYSL